MKYVLMYVGLIIGFSAAQGAQIKTVTNYEDIMVNASITEPNTIVLANDRISQIKAPGNTLVDACNGKPNCKLIDEESGTLTFLPSPLFHTRPFTLNLMTENGNFYNVRVQPKPIPSQTILLKTYLKPVIRNQVPRTSGYEKMNVIFLRSLVNGYLPEGFTQTFPKKRVIYKDKAGQTQLKLLLIVRGNQLRGEVFELTNLTNKSLTIKESTFNWPGTKSIALQYTQLAPHKTMRLYRIS